MERFLYKELLNWKNSKRRKPLVLYGARQVGKTYLLQEFGRNEYKNTLYLNFDKNKKLHQYFTDDISTERIISSLESYFGSKIDAAETLLIFDEIQECERAKDSLKYFCEDAPKYHIAAAGSFLGLASGKFPVGKVNELTLFPMSFFEFLKGTEQNILLQNLQSSDESLINRLSSLATEKLKEYFYVGGMPEAVQIYAESKDLQTVRQVQLTILNNYKADFLKHIKGTDIPKVRILWESIPVHLSKEKKKFVYKEIKTGGRASEFENALDWLVQTGLVHKVSKVNEAKIPLVNYQNKEHFKLYMLDIGLLSAMANLDISAFFDEDQEFFSEFKGALAEQFVLQELKALKEIPVFYWASDTGKAEVDFVLQVKNSVIPVEVKSGLRTKSKSLSVYMQKYKPKYAIRTSLKNYGKDGNLFALPLFSFAKLSFLENELLSPK